MKLIHIHTQKQLKPHHNHQKKNCRSGADLLHLQIERRSMVGTHGSPNAGDRRPRPFDEVLVEYEQFVSRERTKHQGDRAAMTRRSEVTESSTSGRREAWSDQGESTKVSTSEGHNESEGAVLGVERVDDPTLAIPEGLQTQTRG
ncbi:hypothetical protein ACOSQ3_007125 [Xanthoceras sorbifolium]